VSTYPLCCCLSGSLTEVNLRSRDEAAKQRLQQERAAALQEMLAILKGVRVMAPSTGTIGPLLRSFEQRDADPLLQLLSGKTAAVDTISSGVGFQKASSLASTATADQSAASGKKRKPLIALTIPRSKKARVAEGSTGDNATTGGDNGTGSTLSLAFVKSTTQLPAPTVTAPSSFGSSWGWGAAPKASASRGEAGDSKPMKSTAKKALSTTVKAAPSTPLTSAAGKGGASSVAAKTTAAAASIAATKGKIAAKEPSKPAAPAKKKSAKETEAERAAVKEKEKAARAAAKAAAKAEAEAAKAAATAGSSKSSKGGKSKSAAAASTGWGADFAAAFAAELSKPAADAEAEKVAAEFRKAMGHV